MASISPLRPELLYRACDLSPLDFDTTDELPDRKEVIGQPRAVEAVSFGVGMTRGGYNLFAVGPARTGKVSLVRQTLDERAAHRPIPADWCYVNNFAEPHRPRHIGLPAGTGARLRQEMERLVERTRTALAAAFEEESYQQRQEAIQKEFQARSEQALEALRRRAYAEGLSLVPMAGGVTFVPLADGEPMAPAAFEQLDPLAKAALNAKLEQWSTELQAIFHQVPRWARERQEQIQALQGENADRAITPLFMDLQQRYSEHEEVVAFLREARQDILAHLEAFQRAENGQLVHRYGVNLLVDHTHTERAPVVYEDHPTYGNLIGSVEHRAEMGALVTDFTLIKPGALHRANGGYLILDADRLLRQPFSWEALKRSLQSGQIRIESPWEANLLTTVSLAPEPIPLDVKVVLLGDRLLYEMLCAFDPDVSELFKVEVDFDSQMARTVESEADYARLLATLAREQELQPIARNALERAIEQSARLTGDAGRLSTHVADIMDLLSEAGYWARAGGRSVISRPDIEQAIAQQVRRADRLRERLLEETQRGTILIATGGEVIGQINGLAYIRSGTAAFAHPCRITAQVRLGRGELVDIEREVELGGPLHSKGVFILGGYVGARYATELPFSLAASLVFEQSYSMVEGDSASLAELCALLSAIAEVPIRQSLAVTGSVNQLGQVQAIGGVNEKIEGFFDLCQARGLTGEQGVLLPASNVQHLMLRRDVIEAAEAGRFHLYAVDLVDQALELLTGQEAGERDESGCFPEGSINDRVERRLAQFAEAWRAAASSDWRELALTSQP